MVYLSTALFLLILFIILAPFINSGLVLSLFLEKFLPFYLPFLLCPPCEVPNMYVCIKWLTSGSGWSRPDWEWPPRPRCCHFPNQRVDTMVDVLTLHLDCENLGIQVRPVWLEWQRRLMGNRATASRWPPSAWVLGIDLVHSDSAEMIYLLNLLPHILLKGK